jgi:hypothetical protein
MGRTRVVLIVIASSLGLLLLPFAAFAQSSIAGVVKDTSGAVLEPQFNIYNLGNANDVVSQTTRYGASWQNVTGVLPPRMVKLEVQVDF